MPGVKKTRFEEGISHALDNFCHSAGSVASRYGQLSHPGRLHSFAAGGRSGRSFDTPHSGSASGVKGRDLESPVGFPSAFLVTDNLLQLSPYGLSAGVLR